MARKAGGTPKVPADEAAAAPVVVAPPEPVAPSPEPVAPLPPPPPAPAPSAPDPLMPKVTSVTSDVRTLIFNIFVLLLVGLLAPLVISQFWRNEVVIEPIAVPGQLQGTGLTPEIASARLVDALREVDEAGGSAIDAIAVVAATDRVDFSIPDSGLSIDSLVYYVRRFLKIEETRIGGEFRCADSDCAADGITLRLRVSSGAGHVLQIPPMQNASEDEYFYDAALEVMETFRPVVAIAAIMDEQPVKAEVMARRLIRSNSPDSHWAHNLLGLIKVNAGENALGVEQFTAALNLVPDFVPAKANLANTLLLEGEVEEARRLFEEVQRSEPANVRAVEGLADIADRQANRPLAIELYRRATELDPTSTRYLFKAAQMELKAKDEASAMALLEEALQVDPSDPGSLAQLGVLHYNAKDYAAAVPFFRNAADYALDNAYLHFTAGRTMLLADDPASAADRLAIAVRLEPDDVSYKLELADALVRSERFEEATAVLSDAAALLPNDDEVAYRQAINLQYQGRVAEAIAAYRRVIELNPEGVNASMSQSMIVALERENPDLVPDTGSPPPN